MMPTGMFSNRIDTLARDQMGLNDPQFTIYAAAVRQLDEWREDEGDSPSVVTVELPPGFMRVSLAPTTATDVSGRATDWDVTKARHGIVYVELDAPEPSPQGPQASSDSLPA
ncbi:hypothetical protein [Thioalkalivibrio halophilus]|uniref:Uncharacterized protein n=1 Tax=Thioalkalivibrio halophilus TaxID=252474 RepID=A0A1V2ZY82_9GAMM|nr:hypothetical protein [Thioalkalivibrio halophilus]OOC10077.1 hypothetical protein B1A74_07810 [Thioalkalivibrio halophilus]